MNINYQDLPVERRYRALWDRREIGRVSETSPELAARKILKICGETMAIDIKSPRLEIEVLPC